MKRFSPFILLAAVLSCDPSIKLEDDDVLKPVQEGVVTTQNFITKVGKMPYTSETYELIDWYQMALGYDAFVYNRNATGDYMPLIWTDSQHKNIDFDGFGLYTVMGDARQGPSNPGSHEGINVIASVMGAGLVGIDKTNQDGYNYARMCQQYFSKGNGWNIMSNNTGGVAGDWWYNILPNLLYLGVCDIFPGVEGADEIQRKIADKFTVAEKTLNGNYDYSYFNFGTLKGINTGIPKQQDAAGGHGYILLNSFRKYQNAEYLEAAKSAISVLDSQLESRFYEILLPFGAYAAAVLNAAEGCNYNVKRMLDWTFDGCKAYSGRYGWGVTTGKWGPYDVYGLQGSITDSGGYAFLMNSLELPWPLVPMVKYAPEFAYSIGQWMYHCASACRLFYPYHIDDAHQYSASLKELTKGVMGYEGLRYKDRYNTYPGVTPIAEGDGMSWNEGNGPITLYSLYSSSPVGVMGSIVAPTDVDGILRLDCNVTDFYAERPFPVNLYYNPYAQVKFVTYDTNHLTYGDLSYSSGKYDLFDALTRTWVARDIEGNTKIQIPARQAVLLVEVPSGTEIFESKGHIVTSDRTVVAW